MLKRNRCKSSTMGVETPTSFLRYYSTHSKQILYTLMLHCKNGRNRTTTILIFFYPFFLQYINQNQWSDLNKTVYRFQGISSYAQNCRSRIICEPQLLWQNFYQKISVNMWDILYYYLNYWNSDRYNEHEGNLSKPLP